MKKLTELFLKYKELVTYVFFGALTTLVNFLTFSLFRWLLGEELYLLNNAIAWLVSVIFAYITNKLFVFGSKSFETKTLLKEISEFFGARIFSFGLEEGGMWLLIDLLSFGDYSLTVFGFKISGQLIAKLLLSVIVVIFNYFASKLVIFKKKSK
ncbi:MAG: GtrA family protein [Clostridia bacterium]|nr:GtrA family protein [Clostridia bacterium]